MAEIVCNNFECKYYIVGYSCSNKIVTHNEIGMCTEGKEL